MRLSGRIFIICNCVLVIVVRVRCCLLFVFMLRFRCWVNIVLLLFILMFFVSICWNSCVC